MWLGDNASLGSDIQKFPWICLRQAIQYGFASMCCSAVITYLLVTVRFTALLSSFGTVHITRYSQAPLTRSYLSLAPTGFSNLLHDMLE